MYEAKKLVVRIQDPELGPGWYTISQCLPLSPALSDDAVVGTVITAYPDATAVEVSRCYPMPVE